MRQLASSRSASTVLLVMTGVLLVCAVEFTFHLSGELRHVLKKQAGQEPPDAASNAGRWISELIGTDLSHPALTPRAFVHFWMAWAFVNRLTKPESTQ